MIDPLAHLAEECRRNREELAAERRRSIFWLAAGIVGAAVALWTHVEALLWLLG